jgi:hypothetical protein
VNAWKRPRFDLFHLASHVTRSAAGGDDARKRGERDYLGSWELVVGH